MRRAQHPSHRMPIPPISDIPLYVLVAVPCIVLLGYTIFGATGFGSSIISVPGLAHFFPLAFTVPLITTTDAFAATSTAYRLRRLVAWREVRHLLPSQLVQPGANARKPLGGLGLVPRRQDSAIGAQLRPP